MTGRAQRQRCINTEVDETSAVQCINDLRVVTSEPEHCGIAIEVWLLSS